MPRYIDADVLVNQMLNHYRSLVDEYGERDAYVSGYDDSIDTIQSFPTADVVEVTRCENCKYFYKGNMVNRCTLTTLGLKMPHRDAWCCYGEKKES